MILNFLKNKPKNLKNEDSYKKSLRNQSSNNPTDPGRRELIKNALIIAGSTAMGVGVLDRILNRRTDNSGRFYDEVKDSFFSDEEEGETEDLYEKLGDDELFLRSTNEILDYDQEGDIEINSKKMLGVKNYWKKVHSTEGNKLNESLKKAYFEIGVYEFELRRIFIEENVPEKFIYLAIPESYWDLDAESPVKALGPYQFMKQTARDYGIYSDKKKIDYRKDPFKSARAAAKLLSDLYKASEDWDLALSGYNGGHIWRYLSENRGTGNKPNYEDFLKYIEKKINNIRNEIKIGGFVEHEVRSTLWQISERYGVSIEEIKKANNIKDENKIRNGQIIQIPLQNKETKKRIYNRKIAGYRENLNYPAKFNAIYEAIQEGVVKNQKNPENFATHVTNNSYPESKSEVKPYLSDYKIYKVKNGDNLFRIYVNNAQGKISWEDFQKLNKKFLNGVKPSDEIKIPKIIKV